MLYLRACPKLLESDHDPEGEHPGPSASPGVFRTHLAHMDAIRSNRQRQPLLSFETSSVPTIWLEGLGVRAYFCALLNSCCMECEESLPEVKTGPESKCLRSAVILFLVCSSCHKSEMTSVA